MRFVLGYVLQIGITSVVLLHATSTISTQVPLQAYLEPDNKEWVLGVPVELTMSVTNMSMSAWPVETWSRNGIVSFSISEVGTNSKGYVVAQSQQPEEAMIQPITLERGANINVLSRFYGAAI